MSQPKSAFEEQTGISLAPKASARRFRAFTRFSQSWYAKSCALDDPDFVDELVIGIYHPDGGTAGEFSVSWRQLAGRSAPRLKVFVDAWRALQQFQDMLQKMAELDSRDVQPDEFAKMLVECGIEDRTQRENPNRPKQRHECIASPSGKHSAGYWCEWCGHENGHGH